MIYFIAFVLLGVVVFLAKSLWDQRALLKKHENRFGVVFDAEDAVVAAENAVKQAQGELLNVEGDIDRLKKSYAAKKILHDQLEKALVIFNDELELGELGFYKPHFDFDDPESYKEKLLVNKNSQKKFTKERRAIYGTTEWTMGGSTVKGRVFVNRAIRLTARAFNKECDSAIANTRWNNALKMEERIRKAFETINKLNESVFVVISPEYLGLKLDELRLTHEHREKRQQVKEEQAEIKRQMREEAKLGAELERAEKEEARYENMLAKAKEQAEKASGEKLDKLQLQIKILSEDLEEAHSKSERVKSMAQQTRRGHIYVISNIGSFGECVYKIGMTRRLDPFDRVKELGDASVPFRFDIHAMIFSDDAPALEAELHRIFSDQRVNLVNLRKEYFRASLEEIEAEVMKLSPESEFHLTAEAREFRETQVIRKQKKLVDVEQAKQEELPESL